MVRADATARSRVCRRGLAPALVLLASLLGGGCAALTNPVAEGIPVRRLPPELLAAPKNGLESVPLNLLGQARPPEYLLGPGDVLSVYIEGILGNPNFILPTAFAPLNQDPSQLRFPPSTGYPVHVDGDGTISLPQVGPLYVCGMTLGQARNAIRNAYTSRPDLLKPETARFLISLLQPRLCTVMVLRQEASAFTQGVNGIILPTSKRGTGFTLQLPAYENDVLHALLRSGGLPGLDACNEVMIHRNGLALAPGKPGSAGGHEPERIGEVVRIPLRCRRGPTSRPNLKT